VRWIILAAVPVVVVGLAYVHVDRTLTGPLGGDGASVVEAPGSEPEVRKRAYGRCSTNTVEDLARTLGTQDTPEFVAAAVAVKSGNPPVAYKACLRALSD
jgi:hypothetical protein